MAEDKRTSTKRPLDWLSLIAGVATLLIAGYVLGDGPAWWPALDIRWTLAGAAAIAGIVLVATSLRRDQR